MKELQQYFSIQNLSFILIKFEQQGCKKKGEKKQRHKEMSNP
jgi:hypothetical protein